MNTGLQNPITGNSICDRCIGRNCDACGLRSRLRSPSEPSPPLHSGRILAPQAASPGGEAAPDSARFPTAQAVDPALRVQTEGTFAPNREVHPRKKPSEWQLRLWTLANEQRREVSAKLRKLGDHVRADALDQCHSRKTVAKCGNCHRVRTFLNRCDKFYCPECAPSLAKRRRDSIEWWTHTIQQPKHVVLTVKNIKDFSKGHVMEFKAWFANLRRRKFARGWIGGFYSIEVTNENKGWHLHLHALINARWIDKQQLSDEWAKVNHGAGYIVDVSDAHEKRYLKEVSKYAVKGSDLEKWSGERIKQFIDACEGVKLFGVFGNLHGKRTEWREWIEATKEETNQCECGCSRWDYYTEQEWEAHLLEKEIEQQQRPPPPQVSPQRAFHFQGEGFRLLHAN